MAGFTLACALPLGVGFPTPARLLQGLFGWVMIPRAFAMEKVVFPPDRLCKALIPVGPVMGLATVAGSILAGGLLHLDLLGSQWRSIFVVNVPIGVIALARDWRILPRRTGEDANPRLDVGGVALLTLASAMLIARSSKDRELGWPL